MIGVDYKFPIHYNNIVLLGTLVRQFNAWVPVLSGLTMDMFCKDHCQFANRVSSYFGEVKIQALIRLNTSLKSVTPQFSSALLYFVVSDWILGLCPCTNMQKDEDSPCEL